MTKLHESLIQIQKCLVAPKSQFNNFGKYKYRSCEDIVDSFKSLIKDKELDVFLNMSDEIIQVGDRYYIKATVSISDGADKIECSALAREALTKKGMDDSQITGSASSYARKYALNGLFAIDDTKDVDTDENHIQANNNTPEYISELQQEEIKMYLGEDLDLMNKMLAAAKIKGINFIRKESFYDAVKWIKKQKSANESQPKIKHN